MSDTNLTTHALNFHLATDARLGRVAAYDLLAGVGLAAQAHHPALHLTVRYGRGIQLQMIPLLNIDRQRFYEQIDYQQGFYPLAILPDMLRLQAVPQQGIRVEVLLWVADGQHLMGQTTVYNQTGHAVPAQVDWYLQAMTDTDDPKRLPMNRLHLESRDGQSVALAPDVQAPFVALMMDGAQPSPKAKLSTSVVVGAEGHQVVRFVLALGDAGYPPLLHTAETWLHDIDWQTHFRQRQALAASTPQIEVGDDAVDAALALNTPFLLQSLMPDSGQQAKIIARRSMASAALTDVEWFAACASVAVIAPQMIKPVLLNRLREPEPTLFAAQLVSIVQRYQPDVDFVRRVLPVLITNYRRWLAAEIDEGDVWQDVWQWHLKTLERHAIPPQTQHIEIPGFAACLWQEGESIRQLASLVQQDALWQDLAPAHQYLMDRLADTAFAYRDRETKASPPGKSLFTAKGDARLHQPITLDVPARLMIEVEAGNHAPRNLQAVVIGTDGQGNPAEERVAASLFIAGKGVVRAVTRRTWLQIDQFYVEGLSRVYGFRLLIPDLHRQDLTLLLPLTTDALPAAAYRQAMDTLKADFQQVAGLAFLPDTPQWSLPAWSSLLGIGLLAQGEARLSADLWMQMAQSQAQTLQQQGRFFQWYDAQTGDGLGYPQHVAGAMALHWLLALIGVVVIDSATVRITGGFALRKAIKMTWHGVRIARTNRSLKIKFPAGQLLDLPGDVEPQIIHDPQPKSISATPTLSYPETPAQSTGTVRIPLQNTVEPEDWLWASPD